MNCEHWQLWIDDELEYTGSPDHIQAYLLWRNPSKSSRLRLTTGWDMSNLPPELAS